METGIDATRRTAAEADSAQRRCTQMTRLKSWPAVALCASLLQQPALAAKDSVSVRAYVNETCIIADEPYFVPAAPPKDGEAQATAKFLPLLGLVVGKLAELFINHEIQSSASRYKAGVAR